MRLSCDHDLNVYPDAMKQWISDNCACNLASANQALNDVVANKHKATPWTCLVAGQQLAIKHTSAGKKGTWSTCTIFFVEYPEDICFVVALGHHKGNASYTLKYVKPCWTGKRVGEVVDLESD
jgi:hypothetical protein